MELFRQEQWIGLPFHSAGCLPIPGIEPVSPVLQVDSLPAKSSGKPQLADYDSINQSDSG